MNLHKFFELLRLFEIRGLDGGERRDHAGGLRWLHVASCIKNLEHTKTLNIWNL